MYTLKCESLVSERCGMVVSIMRESCFFRLSLATEASRNLSLAIESSSHRYCVFRGEGKKGKCPYL